MYIYTNIDIHMLYVYMLTKYIYKYVFPYKYRLFQTFHLFIYSYVMFDIHLSLVFRPPA